MVPLFRYVNIRSHGVNAPRVQWGYLFVTNSITKSHRGLYFYIRVGGGVCRGEASNSQQVLVYCVSLEKKLCTLTLNVKKHWALTFLSYSFLLYWNGAESVSFSVCVSRFGYHTKMINFISITHFQHIKCVCCNLVKSHRKHSIHNIRHIFISCNAEGFLFYC